MRARRAGCCSPGASHVTCDGSREARAQMLITACSHCHARFRVTPLQLNQKQGQVRCGRCRNVFNGFESLERYPDDDTGSRLLAAREAAEKGSHPLDAIEPLPLGGLPDIEGPGGLM